jgi:hypothetical protein
MHITDADRARKHGLDEFVQANPAEFDHHELFQLMQILTLDYRLNDDKYNDGFLPNASHRSNYQIRRVVVPLTRLTTQGFHMSCGVFCVFNCLRSMVVVHFVDIGGLVELLTITI